MVYWVFLLAGVAFELLGDLYFKQTNIGWGLVLYLIGTGFWALALKQNEFSKAVVVFTLINLIAACVIGRLVLEEPLTPTKYAGLALACLAIFLIES